MNENKKANGAPHYYPRKMRTGWCVAHEVTAAGVTIERYGIKCRTYTEAFNRAEVMNREQLAETKGTGVQAGGMAVIESAVSGTERSVQP